MLNRTILIFSLILLSACSHKPNLQHKIQKLEKQSASIIGISALHLETGKGFSYRENERFPMASTVKVPIAIYLMHLAEHKKINLDKMVRMEPGDLVMGSGLIGYFVSKPGLSISIYNMFEPMMAISDNSCTDTILKQIGGPKAVYKFLQKHDISDILVSRSIEQLYGDSSGLQSWPARGSITLANRVKILNDIPDATKIKAYEAFYHDIRDTTTPAAMVMLLTKLYKYELLNSEYTKVILDVMGKESFSRIKKSLPKDVKIANKTGTWWDDKSSGKQYNYTSEIGIITLPEDKGNIAIAIYLKSDKSNLKKQVDAIGKVARLVYSLYQGSNL